MARPREFDEATALEAAIECFWHRGYEATSVRDLADKMGISGPSLYNAYGDKRALFAQALEHYVDHSARALIKRLETSLPPKQTVRRFIEEIIDRSVNDRERRGCFLINSALEVAQHWKRSPPTAKQLCGGVPEDPGVEPLRTKVGGARFSCDRKCC
jgi:TetR/AcrR family transcriptional repressor of nem operon